MATPFSVYARGFQQGCDFRVRSVPPQEVPRRGSSATPHKAADEDGTEMARKAQP